jgi:hypothetical protein
MHLNIKCLFCTLSLGFPGRWVCGDPLFHYIDVALLNRLSLERKVPVTSSRVIPHQMPPAMKVVPGREISVLPRPHSLLDFVVPPI